MSAIFSLKGINAAEAKAEKESGVVLNQHEDKRGADIAGRAYALDRAMADSLRASTTFVRRGETGRRTRPRHSGQVPWGKAPLRACEWASTTAEGFSVRQH